MLASPAMPLILEFISEAEDLINVDFTCSYLQKANENAGWKIFATKTMALPQSFKAEAGDDLSWKAFLLKHVKPMYLRLSRICNYDPRASGKRLKRNKILHITETCREVLSRHNWPLDVGLFIACHCYLGQAVTNKPLYFFTFGYTDDYKDSTESFAFFDSFCLGGGDTQWWAYVVLKGSVQVPLAPENYGCFSTASGEPVEIGRGGIVVFSHWNHGGSQTTPKHIYPHWDPTEFGFDKVSISHIPLPPSPFLSSLLLSPPPSSPPSSSHYLWIYSVDMRKCVMNG
jgi:hypothetical protein